MGSLLRKLALALGVLAGLAVLLEVGARVWLARLASPEAFRRYATIDALREREGEARFTRHALCGWIPTPGWRPGPTERAAPTAPDGPDEHAAPTKPAGQNAHAEHAEHDSRGFRGAPVETPKPAGETRIACVGASTTYCTSVDDWRESYPARLEAELGALGAPRARVVNAGVPGHTSWEMLASLAFRVLDVEPDVVVVYLGVNDVNPRLVWPPEDYVSDARAYRAPPPPVRWPSVWEHSALARILLVRSGRIPSHADLETALSSFGPSYRGGLFRRQRLQGIYPRGIFAEVPAAEMLSVNRPVFLRRNLESLVAVARQHGARVALVTFAHDPTAERSPRATSPEYGAALAESNAVLVEVAAAAGAELLDLAAAFPREPGWFTDGLHMTAEGNAWRGRWIAERLVATGLVPGER